MPVPALAGVEVPGGTARLGVACTTLDDEGIVEESDPADDMDLNICFMPRATSFLAVPDPPTELVE